MPLNTIPNEGLTSKGYPSDRLVTPIIINGDMSVSQRGTSFASVTSTQYTLDRWRWTPGSGTGTFTLSQSTEVPTGQGFAKSFKADCTATATPSSTNSIGLKTRFEGQNLQMLKKGTSSAESTTLSFWVKSNKTGTYIAELEDNDNSRTINKSYTINQANTWEKKVISYAGDTTGTLNNDNNLSFTIVFYINAGPDLQSGTLQTSWGSLTPANRAVGQVNLADSTDNEWYMTGCQWEVGEFDSTTIPSFPFESFESNLRKCKRYTHRIDGNATNDTVVAPCAMASTSQVRSPFMFPVTMRTTPSVTESDLEIQDDANAHTASSLGLTFGACDSSIALVINADSGSPFTSGEAGLVKINNTTSGFLMFDAEL